MNSSSYDSLSPAIHRQMEFCFSEFQEMHQREAMSEEKFAATRLGQYDLIGVHGLKRSGKDTFASNYQAAAQEDNRPASVGRIAFADAMKETMIRQLGIPRAWVHGEDIDRETPRIELHGLSARKFMQFFGTEVLRTRISYDVHAELTLGRIAQNPVGTTMLVTDVRFENEARLLKRLGGDVLEVKRTSGSGTDASTSLHASERPLPADLVDRSFSCASLEANRVFAYGEYDRRTFKRANLPTRSRDAAESRTFADFASQIVRLSRKVG